MTDATSIALFDLSPAIDREAAAARYASEGRVQIRDFLTAEAARAVHHVLARETPWGLGWRAGEDGPHSLRRQDLGRIAPQHSRQILDNVDAAMKGRDYAFLYARYPMVDAYREQWNESEGLAALLEHINAEPLLEMVRAVTATPEIVKADGQATLYAPSHFLAVHDDADEPEGRRVAYVMNFCAEDWRPDWGGYLLFYDEDGDVVAGYRPRFNALNMFRVPQKHSVTFVPPFAPIGRFAITGWFRDR
ncbi:MAG TPA: 2OG-Fe(II) oxygenase family protein [Allosphingosinicella sp.]